MKGIYKRVTSTVLACSMTAMIGFTAAGEVSNNILKNKTGYPFTKFNNTPQDAEHDTEERITGKVYENTRAGLHTDKTVIRAYPDGRTFDLNLEAWRIGTNTADVSVILDASGSMAWVSENIPPYYVGTEFSQENAPDLYNGFFLKDDVLDQFLEPTLTDNSSLSYTDYRYYIYDDRETVQEYVPLGYWNGVETTMVNPVSHLESTWASKGQNLIGYYPFQSGNYSPPFYGNKINNAEATIIEPANENNIFSGESTGASFSVSGTGKLRTNSTLDKSKAADSAGDLDRALGNQNNPNVLLDVTPESGSAITLAFSLYLNSGSANVTYKQNGNLNDTDVFIIAPLGEDYKSTNHIRFNLTDKPRFYAINNSNYGRTFEDNLYMKKVQFITVVIDPSKDKPDNFIVYIDGTEYKQNNLDRGFDSSLLKIDNPRIIFAPGVTSSSSPLAVDEIYVFNSALSADDVKKLYNDAPKQLVDKYVGSDSNSGPDQSDRAYAGDTVIGQLDSTDYAKSSRSKGWYYVNSSGDWALLQNTGTGKQLKGLLKNEFVGNDALFKNGYYPQLICSPSWTDNMNTACGPDTDTIQYDTLFNSDREAFMFYVDNEGYLRCLANSGANTKSKTDDQRTYFSYVYLKNPDQITKVQMLDSALTSFTDGLFRESPKSRISAVRFSTDRVVENNKDNIPELRMLPWTDQNAAVENYGGVKNLFLLDDNVSNYSPGRNGNYPYTLTGGTAAWTGFEAYSRFLAGDAGREVDGKYSKKYIILFTDGVDDSVSKNLRVDVIDKNNNKTNTYAIDYATALKNATNTNMIEGKYKYGKSTAPAYQIKAHPDDNDGYTIFTVMLTGGVGNTSDKAGGFLSSLAGDVNFDPSNVEDLEKYCYYAYDMNTLNKAFDDILALINQSLENYIVQDYIDPRFDLVDENGNVIELKAGGNISLRTPGGSTIALGQVDKVKGYEFTCETKYETNNDGISEKRENKVTLYYDSGNDMYFLKWKNCTIPMTAAANELIDDGKKDVSVWSSKITIKAKEDFIGGNNILTNGNKPGMNLVYSEKDTRAKDTLSGTDLMAETADNKYPAKGFPRTTVNVRLKDIKTEVFEDVVYLGQLVSPADMLTDIEHDFMADSYYLEYLRRYAIRLGTDTELEGSTNHEKLISLLNQWLQIDKLEDSKSVKSFTIPYMYLPNYGTNSVKLNNTGDPDTHQKDILGILTYEWEKLDPPDDKAANPWKYTAKKDPYISSVTDQIKYSLTVRYTPLTDEDDFNNPNPERGEYKFLSTSNNSTVDDIFFNKKFEPANTWVFGKRPDYNESMIKDNDYNWHKPAVGEKQLAQNRSYCESGNVTKKDYFTDVVGDDTLKAETPYTKNVVSGGLALEIYVPVGDLQKNLINGAFKKTLRLTATRTYVHSPEDQKTITENNLQNADYGPTFELTYQFNYSAADIETLIKGKKSTDYVSLFASFTGVSQEYIKATFHGTGDASKTQLPIGTYEIQLSSLSDKVFVADDAENTTFTKIYGEDTSGLYRGDRFTNDVYDNDMGVDKDNKPHQSKWEIDDGLTKIGRNTIINSKYIADYQNQSGFTSVRYYLGTGTDNRKGVTSETSYDYYINKRLGMICLSYGKNSLELTKNVKNSEDDKDTEWTFNVSLYSDTPLDTDNFTAEYTDSDGNPISNKTKPSLTPHGISNGRYLYLATVRLKHGESIKFSDFVSADTSNPKDPDIQYEISEDKIDDKNYDVEFEFEKTEKNKQKAEGTVSIGSKVVCNNIFPVKFPDLGGIGTRVFMLLGGGMVLMSMLLLGIRYRKKIIRTQNN